MSNMWTNTNKSIWIPEAVKHRFYYSWMSNKADIIHHKFLTRVVREKARRFTWNSHVIRMWFTRGCGTSETWWHIITTRGPHAMLVVKMCASQLDQYVAQSATMWPSVHTHIFTCFLWRFGNISSHSHGFHIWITIIRFTRVRINIFSSQRLLLSHASRFYTSWLNWKTDTYHEFLTPNRRSSDHQRSSVSQALAAKPRMQPYSQRQICVRLSNSLQRIAVDYPTKVGAWMNESENCVWNLAVSLISCHVTKHNKAGVNDLK